MNDLEDKNIVLSITAHIDLLGFSNHLQIANNDLRSTIGKEATDRLKTIEKAIMLFLKEKKKFPKIYPKEKDFDFIRFNDSLFLSISVAQHIIPDMGDTNVGDYQLDDVMSVVTYKENMKIRSEDFTKKYAKKYSDEGRKVAKFVGLVARVHEFIKKEETRNNFPGPRTIISTGLRRKFLKTDKNSKKEDFFSANFSLSNAYKVNEKGSKEGIAGNKIFVEDNVARIISYNKKYKSLVVLSKYLINKKYCDPYEEYNSSDATKFNITVAEPIEINLFGKKYVFRELNSETLSNLQLIPFLEKFLDNKKLIKKGSLEELFVDSYKKEIPTLDQIRSIEALGPAMPLLCIIFGLDKKPIIH